MNANMMMAVNAIKDTISAQDVGEALGLEIRHGRCQCPIHGGHDFNCVLYKGNRGYYCHVCKQGGDVIRFAQSCLFAGENHSMSFKDTVAWFNDTFRMGLDLKGTITQDQRRQAEMAQRMRKNAIEFAEWKERTRFGLALAADQILEKLEECRDRHVPKTKNERWSPQFCEAVRMIPEAQRFAEDCMMDCIGR